MSGEMMLFPSTVEEFMEQYKVVDRDHVLSNGAEFVPVFRMRQWFDHLQAPPITNADRIRSMTDMELSEFLWDVWRHKHPFYKECIDGWLVPFHRWLKQEASK